MSGMVKINIFKRDCQVAINRGFCVRRTEAINYKSFDEIPGPKSYPTIGTIYKYLPIIGDYDAEALDKNAIFNYRRYGSIVRESPGVRLVHIFDPELMEAVFRQDDRFPSRRSHVAMYHYRTNKPDSYNTGGLLSTNGPDWWKLRSAFQKNFTSPQSVKEHTKKVDNVVKDFVKWIKEARVSQNCDFLDYLSRLNLEIIGVVGFNERFESFSSSEQHADSRSSKLIEAAFGSNSGIMKLDKGFLWKYFNTPLYKSLVRSQEYLEKVANEILLKRATFFENVVDLDDTSLLASFLQLQTIDLKDIRGMMVDMLMAAIDTTAYSTAFVLYHLSRNSEILKKALEEIHFLLPEKDSSITSETISKANYIRSIIKESLRLNPVSIGVGRLLQKDMVLQGYYIPKDTVIVTQNMIASRLPQCVKDPLQFKPERWIRNSSEYENLHPFLSLPFGFGTRSCIARRLAEQNMCITLMRTLRAFNLKWVGGELGIKTLLINKPDKPLLFSLTPRDN